MYVGFDQLITLVLAAGPQYGLADPVPPVPAAVPPAVPPPNPMIGAPQQAPMAPQVDRAS
jgi:hypothetical protein